MLIAKRAALAMDSESLPPLCVRVSVEETSQQVPEWGCERRVRKSLQKCQEVVLTEEGKMTTYPCVSASCANFELWKYICADPVQTILTHASAHAHPSLS